MMDLSVNIPLEKALDLGWEILAACFRPEETGLRTELIKEFWPGIAERKPAEAVPAQVGEAVGAEAASE
jgi:V/A-type H+-transporting ATPase subunit B